MFQRSSCRISRSANKDSESAESIIEIIPPVLTFLNFKTNTLYQGEVLLKNKGKEGCRLRVLPCRSGKFKTHLDHRGLLAPGLSAKLLIRFRAQSQQDYHDITQLILNEKHQISVPLQARCSSTTVQIPQKIDLRLVKINSPCISSFTVKNHDKQCHVALQKEPGSPITLQPESFVLKENQQQTIQLTILPRLAGLQKHLILAVLDEGRIEKTVDVLFTGIEYQCFLKDEQGFPLKKMDLGNCYLGNQKQIKCFFVNASPEVSNVSLQLHCGNPDVFSFQRHRTPQDYGKELTEKIVSVEPQRFQVQPFGCKPLTVKYECQPKQQHVCRLMKFVREQGRQPIPYQNYKYCLIVKSNFGQFVMPIEGRHSVPSVRLSNIDVDFGFVQQNKKTQQSITIQNCDDMLPIRIRFQRVGWLNVEPRQMQLRPSQIRQVKLSLEPKNLGPVQRIQTVIIENSYKISIKIRAKVIHSALNNTLKENALRQSRYFKENSLSQKILSLTQVRPKSTIVRRSTIKHSEDENRDTPSLFGCGPSLSRQKDSLFVVKTIRKYEPFNKSISRHDDPIAVSQCRTTYKNQQQASQIAKALSGQMLKQIKISPRQIDFGRIFKHSTAKQYFFLTNRLTTSIQARLEFDRDDFSLTDKSRKIIGSGQRAKFQIVIQPQQRQAIRCPIRYIINQEHTFQITACALCQNPSLQLSKTSIKFSVHEDVDNFQLSQHLQLTNNGNWKVKYTIQNNSRCIFSPQEGTVKESSSENIAVHFKPISTGIQYAGEPKNLKQFSKSNVLSTDTRALFKIEDGQDISLRIVTQSPEPKCYIVEQHLNMGTTTVFRSKSASFTLKNITKIPALFFVDCQQVSDCCTITPQRGCLSANSSKEFRVQCKATHEHEIRGKAIYVNIRGGARIQLPLFSRCILPNITIVENQINFGTVSASSTTCHPLTFQNFQTEDVRIIVDLTPGLPGIECLEFIQENVVRLNDYRVQLTIPAEKSVQCQLKFRPVNARIYSFQLPILLEGVLKLKSLTRTISCIVRESLISVEPQQIQFKKKIVTNQQEKSIPFQEWITIRKNPGPSLLFRLGDQILQSDVFTAKPTQGVLENDKPCLIKISFNPTTKGHFKVKFPLLLLSQDSDEYICYSEVTLEGQGDEPRLIFNCLQAILPPVPLGVESRLTVRIHNEGYENLTVVPRLEQLEQNNVDLKMDFPEGLKIGINRTSIPLCISLISHKSVSFTTRIQIMDSVSKVYSLVVSGTVDNSLLTTYPYLEATEPCISRTNYKLFLQPTYFDEQAPIPPQTYFEPQKKVLQKWIKYTINDDKITGRFPEMMIQSRGDVLHRFLLSIVGKKEQLTSQCEPGSLLWYDHLLRTLKNFGCLLNHIRAYHLLSQSQFQEYLEQNHRRPEILNKKYTFWYVSLNSWSILIYQLINQFVFLKKTIPSPLISNVYSPTQLGLIQWTESICAEYNYNKVEINEFRENLRDGVALLYLLYHHLPLKTNQLDGIIKNPRSDIQIGLNIRKLQGMMSQMGLPQLATEEQMLQMADKEYCLVLKQLYAMLPHFNTKPNCLQFSSYIGQEISKFIEISNPHSKTLVYVARIEGSSEFSLQNYDLIRIDPKKSHRLKVTYSCRRFEPTKAYVILTAKSVSASALVFQLKGEVIGRKSVKILQNIECPLYQSTTKRIQIQNIFTHTEVGNFEITLQPDTKDETFIPCLFSDLQVVKLRRSNANFIQLTFCPLKIQATKYYILFSDGRVGQFQYEVMCIPTAPLPLLEIRPIQQIFVQQQENIQISLPFLNNHLSKAISNVENKLRRESQTVAELTKFKKMSDQTFNVQCIMAEEYRKCVSLPSSLVMSRKLNETDSLMFRFRFSVKFSTPEKDFPLSILLSNGDQERKFNVILNILPKPLKIQLEMKTPARNTLVQPIPIVNNGDRDWKLKAVLQVDSPQLTLRLQQKATRQIICRKNQSIQLQLTYSPLWIGELDGRLLISNITTNQIVEYTIKCVGQEPLSEQHLEIKCKHRELQQVDIEVYNPFSSQTFTVQTDLLNCFGNQTIYLQNAKKSTYCLTVNPIISGILTGSLIFHGQAGRYFWFTLSLNTEPQMHDDHLEICSPVFRQTLIELEMQNPLDQDCNFEAHIKGRDLDGDRQIFIPKLSTRKYTLYFHPKEVFELYGRISLLNEKLGQKIYLLRLKSQQFPAEKISSMRCYFGSVVTRTVQLYNHLKDDLTLKAEIDNPAFTIELPVMKAQSYNSFLLTYRPRQPFMEDNCSISLHHPQFGHRKYTVVGFSTFQPKTVERIVCCRPGEMVYESISFTNPFGKLVIFKVEMLQQEAASFNLQRGSPFDLTVKPYDTVHIPFAFRCRQAQSQTAIVSISANETIKWTHKLIGQQELEASQLQFFICTEAKQLQIQKITIPLWNGKQSSELLYVLDYAPTHQKLIQNCLDITLADWQKSSQTANFILTFRPKKAFKLTVDLIITIGCAKKFKIHLEAKPPHPEGLLQIHTALNTIAKRFFVLGRTVLEPTDFQAKIDGPHASLFRLEPNEGKLLPNGTNQSQNRLLIVFNPPQSGRSCSKARLHIKTLIEEWIYQLKGTVPQYRPPIKSSKFKNTQKIK